MEYLFLLTLWEACLIGAFIGGYFVGKRKKAKAEPKPLTEEEKRAEARRRQEEENFRTYDGRPQNPLY